MRRLWLWIRFGKQCTARRPGSLHGPEWSQCIHRGDDHPSFNGALEHYNGKVWWT